MGLWSLWVFDSYERAVVLHDSIFPTRVWQMASLIYCSRNCSEMYKARRVLAIPDKFVRTLLWSVHAVASRFDFSLMWTCLTTTSLIYCQRSPHVNGWSGVRVQNDPVLLMLLWLHSIEYIKNISCELNSLKQISANSLEILSKARLSPEIPFRP